jgi:CRISPR-associated protein Cas5d
MQYAVSIEIAGPLAMFARPDTGGTPTSYPVPTWSACKGMFESIMRFASGEAWICPTRVEVCRREDEPAGPVRWQRYTTNYGGPLRKGNQLALGASYQLVATVLANVCYRVYGEVRGTRRSGREGKYNNNSCRELQERFERALRQGRVYRTPCLGWSEFTATYWGTFRAGTVVNEGVHLRIPSLLCGVFAEAVSSPTGGRYAPRFVHNVEVRGGVLEFRELEAAAC